MSKFWESDLEAGYYDILLTNGLQLGRGIKTNWHNITFLYTKNYIKDNVKHLDYACGPGTLIGRYSCANSIGVDLAKSQIRYAKENFNNKGVFLNTKEFEFNNYNEYFDVVTVLGLIEFLSDEEISDLLINIYNSLKPGGKAIFTTPNFNSLIYPISEKLNLVNWGGQHKNKFNMNKVQKIFSRSQFSKINNKKILNPAMFFSLINIELGIFFEKFFGSLTLNKHGFLIFVELEK